jgi:hypothetical protein
VLLKISLTFILEDNISGSPSAVQLFNMQIRLNVMECNGVLARVMDKLQGHLKLASLVLLSSAGAVYALLTLVTTQVY